MKIIILVRGFQPITNGEIFSMNNNITIIEIQLLYNVKNQADQGKCNW